MKFNLPQPAPEPPFGAVPQVGNVYRSKGGGKTHFWIIVGLDERTVNLLGINRDGAVTSTANYGIHVFNGTPGFSREIVGRCDGLDGLDFDITWIGGAE